MAAWLTGSNASGEADAFSDVDISVVVAGSLVGELAAAQNSRRWADAQRLEFLEQFGEIANLHESRGAGSDTGTLISVLYANGITVDWSFLSTAEAKLPSRSLILFSRASLPQKKKEAWPAEAFPERKEERIRFFWMMAAVAAKAILRGESLRFHVFYEGLLRTQTEIQQLKERQIPIYRANRQREVYARLEQQKQALLSLCEQVDRAYSKSPTSRLKTIKLLLDLHTG